MKVKLNLTLHSPSIHGSLLWQWILFSLLHLQRKHHYSKTGGMWKDTSLGKIFWIGNPLSAKNHIPQNEMVQETWLFYYGFIVNGPMVQFVNKSYYYIWCNPKNYFKWVHTPVACKLINPGVVISTLVQSMMILQEINSGKTDGAHKWKNPENL